MGRDQRCFQMLPAKHREAPTLTLSKIPVAMRETNLALLDRELGGNEISLVYNIHCKYQPTKYISNSRYVSVWMLSHFSCIQLYETYGP